MRIKYLPILAFVLFGTTLTNAATFKALRDFTANNPNGAWSYGYASTMRGAFNIYDTFEHDCQAGVLVGEDCWDAYPNPLHAQVGKNATGAAFAVLTLVVPTDALLMHPGGGLERSIVRWTCPKSGTYGISGFFEILDAYPTGIRPKIFVNRKSITTEAFGGDSGELTGPGANQSTLKAGQRKNFSFTRSIKRGTTISFGVSPAGNFGFDSTGFDATITRLGL